MKLHVGIKQRFFIIKEDYINNGFLVFRDVNTLIKGFGCKYFNQTR